jgi:chromosome segregation ATPase
LFKYLEIADLNKSLSEHQTLLDSYIEKTSTEIDKLKAEISLKVVECDDLRTRLDSLTARTLAKEDELKENEELNGQADLLKKLAEMREIEKSTYQKQIEIEKSACQKQIDTMKTSVCRKQNLIDEKQTEIYRLMRLSKLSDKQIENLKKGLKQIIT